MNARYTSLDGKEGYWYYSVTNTVTNTKERSWFSTKYLEEDSTGF